MNLPRPNNKLVLLLPWILFGFGIWTAVQSDNEIQVQFDRAENFWRTGNYQASVDLYSRIATQYPQSTYAPQALWEIGTIEYINLYRVERANETFNIIVEKYPDHPLSLEALKRLAEIHEVEFKDFEMAVKYWEQLLERPLEASFRQEVQLRLGNAWFLLGELTKAQDVLAQLVKSEGLSTYLRQQVSIRLGTIFQLREQHAEAIPFFEQALGARDCSQCRLAGQLGLIECYEFLGDLQTALTVASGIDEMVYSATLKQELLDRLEQKERFFNPTSWTGAR